MSGAGDYAVTVSYSNQNVSGSHAYNPQVVDVRLSIAEEFGDASFDEVGSSGMRYTNHWESFWDRTIGVRLGTADGSLKLQSAALMEPWSTWTVLPPWGTAAPAYLDKITIAPVQAGQIATEKATPSISAKVAVTSRCTEGLNQLTVTATNTDDERLTFSIETEFGTKTFTHVPPGRSQFQPFPTGMADLPAGWANVTITNGDDEGATLTQALAYNGRSC